jgi:SAM-dependent methyltransferase
MKDISAREFLKASFTEEVSNCFGIRDYAWIEGIVDGWMDDRHSYQGLFDEIMRHAPGARKILDMASGCGNLVFYGLLHGYDMYGIEPEKWKRTFVGMKARDYGYPAEWLDRFHSGTGEELPFPDASFDCVSSHQTLEHVRDPRQCIREMIRVTRPGGTVQIRCPDYRGTYEGHYLLPWLPLLPRPLAGLYLRLLARPLEGLRSINYVTTPRVKRWLEEVEARTDYAFSTLDLEMTTLPVFMRKLFRSEMSIRLVVRLEEK